MKFLHNDEDLELLFIHNIDWFHTKYIKSKLSLLEECNVIKNFTKWFYIILIVK